MANKNDVISKDELSDENKALIEEVEKDGVQIFWTSTGTKFLLGI